MPRPRRHFTPYTPPSGAPPLEDVVCALAIKNKQLAQADEDIVRQFRHIERMLEARGVRRIVRARIVAGVDLAWSMNKRGRWRMVIRDEDGAVDLLNVEPEERIEAITSGALERVVKEALRT